MSLVVSLHQGKRKVCVQIDSDIDFSSESDSTMHARRKTQASDKVVQAASSDLR